MSYTVPVVHKSFVTSPSFYALSRPITWSIPSIPVAVAAAAPVTVETRVSEPKVVSVSSEPKRVSVDTKVEQNFPFTTTTTTTTTTEVTKEVKAPHVTSTCLWHHGPVNFWEIQQLERY